MKIKRFKFINRTRISEIKIKKLAIPYLKSSNPVGGPKLPIFYETKIDLRTTSKYDLQCSGKAVYVEGIHTKDQ